MPETFLGLPIATALMWGAGIVYLVAVAMVWRAWREERSELMDAFLAFLLSMAAALLFMGGAGYWQSTALGYVGGFAILLGSVYMLRFPLLSFPSSLRRPLFWLALLVALGLFLWLLFVPSGQRAMSSFLMWYMIIVNGFSVGFFIFFAGMMAQEKWFRVKAAGGGAGVATCCVFSHVAVMSGSANVGALLQFIAPLIIVAAVSLGRHYQQTTAPQPTSPLAL